MNKNFKIPGWVSGVLFIIIFAILIIVGIMTS